MGSSASLFGEMVRPWASSKLGGIGFDGFVVRVGWHRWLLTTWNHRPRFTNRGYYTGTASSSNSQIAQFARLGQIENARKLFDELSNKTIASWNSIVSGYFQNHLPRAAEELFQRMPDRNIISWNGLISGYLKNGMVNEARKAFDRMPERNIVSWTAMVQGYVQAGMMAEAEALFWQLPEKNVVSWTVMLGGFIREGCIHEARNLYDMMPVKDVVARTNMIDGYCKMGLVTEAREIFDEMPERNVVSWTAMINGYVQSNRLDIARKLFEVMPMKNEVSWTAMLVGYTQCGRMEEASALFDAMPGKSVMNYNAMIIGYGQNGEVEKARRLFDGMMEKDDGTWSAMIRVYEREGFELEALDLFISMQKVGAKLNFTSVISILSVCANLASLDHGRQVHAQLVKSQFDIDMYVASVLITMYIKCGDLLKAKMIFENFGPKDVVMWNSIITGYAQHGLGEEALQVFKEMLSCGVTPDDVTFIGVLTACSYTGKVKEGHEFFESMKSEYLVVPKAVHYACMVDLLGRAGRVDEAMNLIENMPVEADAVVWGALLGACRTHSKLDLAEFVAKKLLQLEPESAGPYILLSSLYASKGRWKDVSELRESMKARSVIKSPGCSWIEADKQVHMFTASNSMSHPEYEMIMRMLDKLDSLLRDAGYNPDRSFVLHDLDAEEKDNNLRHHSEKLAVAYGLLKVPKEKPIRVMKNLRVCGDCHTAMKLIAKVTGREIILRDANRFHHFKNGVCSCRDYW